MLFPTRLRSGLGLFSLAYASGHFLTSAVLIGARLRVGIEKGFSIQHFAPRVRIKRRNDRRDADAPRAWGWD